MKKIALFLVFLLVLSGCRNVGKTEIPKENYPVVVGGMKFLEPPERVVVLSDGLFNVISEAGLEKHLLKDIDKGDEYYPDAEKIIEEKAELVLSFIEIEASVIKKLNEAKIRVLVFKKPTTLSELKGVISSVSRLFLGDIEGEKKAEEVFKKYENEVKPIQKAFAESSFVYIKNRELEPVNNSLLSDVLSESFKGENPKELSRDALKELNPDYIFLGSGVDKTYLTALEIAENLSAIENERVIPLPENILDSFKLEAFKELRAALGIE